MFSVLYFALFDFIPKTNIFLPWTYCRLKNCQLNAVFMYLGAFYFESKWLKKFHKWSNMYTLAFRVKHGSWWPNDSYWFETDQKNSPLHPMILTKWINYFHILPCLPNKNEMFYKFIKFIECDKLFNQKSGRVKMSNILMFFLSFFF